MKRKIVACAAGAGLAAVCIAAGVYAWNQPAAYVGEIPVQKEELQLYLDENRAQTAAYFSSNYQLDLSDAKAWNKECDGITAKEYQMQAALASLQQEKALLTKANESRPELPVTGEEIEKAREAENKERSRKLAAGEVLYGPAEYGQMEYRSYLCSQAEAEIEQQILEQELPDEKQLQELYEQMDSDSLDKGYVADVDYYCLSEEVPLDESQRQQLLQVVEQQAGKMETEQLLEKCKQEYGVEPIYQMLQIGPDARKGEDLLQMEVYNEVREVEANTAKAVERDGRLVAVLYVRSRESYGKVSFEESKDLLLDQWAAEQMQKCVEQQLGQMEAKPGVLASFKVNQ